MNKCIALEEHNIVYTSTDENGTLFGMCSGCGEWIFIKDKSE